MVAGLVLATTLASGCSSAESADGGATGTGGRAPAAASSAGAVFEGSDAEYDAAILDCLAGRGWPAVTTDGAATFPGSEGDPEGFDRAFAACQRELGTPAPPDYSDAQFAAMYEFQVGTRECLIGLGYPISEPPTVQQWTDSYRASLSNGQPPWLPWFELTAPAPGVEEQCPQAPRDGWPAYFAAQGVDG
ncbi:hypothetical protein DQ237_06020 [Blastococcus sp. TF02-8]|nr:hypothetical protein DQ237_06020 [Blastococcus sp. TF02-8]